ncbi:MAG: cytidine deaminase [Veillonellaceae bacterium]|nr:cytidine deaminase [Veillonellaceae bacterium]
MATNEELRAVAAAMQRKAYAPYSRFAVGAAVVAGNGKVYGGCNVENASYGLTVCAERNAIAAAIADGQRELHKLAVVGPIPEVTPCGACRQVMAEFGICEVLLGTGENTREVMLADLLPAAFTKDV